MASSDRTRSRIAVIGLLVSIGVVLIVAGSVQLTALAGAYRDIDIRLTETPGTFHAWFADLAREAPANDDPHNRNLSRRVADRLLIMPLPARRRVIVYMAGTQFWDDISPDLATQQTARTLMLNGVLLALQSEPGAGDLYFSAARLETELNGYGERPRRLLEASSIFSPNEIDIAIERLVLTPLIWPSLTGEEKSRFKRDLEYVGRSYPNSAVNITKELNEQGVSFD